MERCSLLKHTQIAFNILRIYCDSQTSMGGVRVLCQVYESHKTANVHSVVPELARGDDGNLLYLAAGEGMSYFSLYLDLHLCLRKTT